MLAVGDERSVNLKSGGTTLLKEYTIYDESCKSITLTVWDMNSEGQPKGLELLEQKLPVAIRNLKVNDFRGKTVSTSRTTVIEKASELPQTIKRLPKFMSFVESGGMTQVTPLSEYEQGSKTTTKN